MKKGCLILSVLGLLVSTSTQARVNVCVFDLLGKSGESYKLLEEWALAAKGDAFYMTSMRARAYNKFAGSIDAIGGVPNNDIAMKAISYVVDKRNSKRLITQIGKEKFEVAGIGQIGPAYIFVRDRKLNKL